MSKLAAKLAATPAARRVVNLRRFLPGTLTLTLPLALALTQALTLTLTLTPSLTCAASR